MKACERCGKIIEPRIRASGNRESEREYQKRRFCSLSCVSEPSVVRTISKDQWRALYWNEEYPTLRTVAERLGCAMSTVREYLQKNEIRIRSKAEQARIDVRKGRRTVPPGVPNLLHLADQLNKRADIREASKKRVYERKLWQISATARREKAERALVCGWCTASFTRMAHGLGSFTVHYCGRACTSRGSHHLREKPDQPRPLFVARLMEHLKDRLPIRASLENLAAEIGATEDEVIEAVLNAADP